MKKKDLTNQQIDSVSCPHCGVGPGRKCIQYSGSLRREPHTSRTLAAMDAPMAGTQRFCKQIADEEHAHA